MRPKAAQRGAKTTLAGYRTIRRDNIAGLHRSSTTAAFEPSVSTQPRPIRELVTVLNTRAEETGLSFQELWAMLAQHWARAEIIEPIGFLEAGLEARAMIGGKQPT